MIHVQTGNKLDVVYTYEGNKIVLKGLCQHGKTKIIPLPDPQGLIEVLQSVMRKVTDNV